MPMSSRCLMSATSWWEFVTVTKRPQLPFSLQQFSNTCTSYKNWNKGQFVLSFSTISETSLKYWLSVMMTLVCTWIFNRQFITQTGCSRCQSSRITHAAAEELFCTRTARDHPGLQTTKSFFINRDHHKPFIGFWWFVFAILSFKSSNIRIVCTCKFLQVGCIYQANHSGGTQWDTEFSFTQKRYGFSFQ